jgi:hypothetical protein
MPRISSDPPIGGSFMGAVGGGSAMAGVTPGLQPLAPRLVPADLYKVGS